jgi:hypothetical protein
MPGSAAVIAGLQAPDRWVIPLIGVPLRLTVRIVVGAGVPGLHVAAEMTLDEVDLFLRGLSGCVC